MKTLYKIAIITAVAGLQQAHAQKKDENIGTEVVNVVKPYTPTISDAFKVKETPVIEDENNTKKEEIKYNIFSYPVASTFSPAKGKAATVDQEAREKYFSNYATLGFGNYGTVTGEVFVTHNLDDTQYVGALLRHNSSQGGIKDVKLDDNFSTNGIDLTYGNRQKEYTWSTDLGYQRQVYNWYGVNPDIYNGYDEFLNGLDTKQTYSTFYVGGKISARNSFFHEAQMQYKHFSDGFSSAENRFFITPDFDVNIGKEKVKFGVVADYVGGDFNQDFFAMSGGISYSNFNLGVQPSILFQRQDTSVQFGAGVFYSMGKINDASNNKFYIYPQIKASHKLVGDLMVVYAGAEGGLKQNSYADFVGQNPFVSPTLMVAPTNQQFDLYLGLKGKLASPVSYNIRAGYLSEDDHAFFLHNPDAGIIPAVALPNDYVYGNSFGVMYDNLKTISFFGELKADFSNTVNAGLNATYYSYNTDAQEAWNMPSVKVGATFDIKFAEKWQAGTNIFFVGERKDQLLGAGSALPTAMPDVITLKSYFDVNANVSYKYNERLTGFLKLNNIANQNYQKWAYYPVQGFQFLLGATYKFNF
jgi:hypothetical protein